MHSESGGCDSHGQFPSDGPQPQFQLHHASNSSRCSSSVIENSSSSPNFSRSFSLIATSHEDVEALEKQLAARVSGVEEVEAELLFSFRGCEVQYAAIKSGCCK